jgi:hypothetical protein
MKSHNKRRWREQEITKVGIGETLINQETEGDTKEGDRPHTHVQPEVSPEP